MGMSDENEGRSMLPSREDALTYLRERRIGWRTDVSDLRVQDEDTPFTATMIKTNASTVMVVLTDTSATKPSKESLQRELRLQRERHEQQMAQAHIRHEQQVTDLTRHHQECLENITEDPQLLSLCQPCFALNDIPSEERRRGGGNETRRLGSGSSGGSCSSSLE